MSPKKVSNKKASSQKTKGHKLAFDAPAKGESAAQYKNKKWICIAVGGVIAVLLLVGGGLSYPMIAKISADTPAKDLVDIVREAMGWLKYIIIFGTGWLSCWGALAGYKFLIRK